jgi:hypothetical protein
MTDLKKAAQQALKSLRGYRRELWCQQPCDAERALEAALEQPEQEPVACIRTWHKGSDQHAELLDWTDALEALPDGEHLLSTHPPRREWRGLTEEEIYPLYSEPSSDAEMVEFARAIEAALRSKNYE